MPGLFALLAIYLRPPESAVSPGVLALFWSSWGGSMALAVGLIAFAGRLARWTFPDRADDPAVPVPETLVDLQNRFAPALAIIGAVLLALAVPDLLYDLARASKTAGTEPGAPEWLRCLAQFFIGLSFFVFPRSITRLVHQLHNLASEKSTD
jgi:hypothetical protein